MIQSYPDALKYLYENLPMFQRVGAVAIKKDLTNTRALCDFLGNPQNSFRSIHVAGTNGKGSTCHMLASVLQTAGYKTGLYTSPHLKEFTERIKVNGKEVSREYVLDFVNRMRSSIESIRPSFFEITVCMAFDYFAREKVDVAVVEVGLGGRLDSTNVITPVASVITNIGWDHMDLLGHTLTEIAEEKAGIIKRNVPVIVSERQPEVAAVFLRKAEAEHAALSFASDSYTVVSEPARGTLGVLKDGARLLENIQYPLSGLYQRRNIAGVMNVLAVLAEDFPVGPEAIKEGLEGTVTNTGLKGRWQKIAYRPTVVCDTAHNADGVKEVLRQLASEDFEQLHIVWGSVKDKDVSKVLALLPREAMYYFCQASIPRAMDAHVLQREALKFGLTGEVFLDVNQAKRAALGKASPSDLVFIGGSTYVVAEIDEL